MILCGVLSISLALPPPARRITLNSWAGALTCLEAQFDLPDQLDTKLSNVVLRSILATFLKGFAYLGD